MTNKTIATVFATIVLLSIVALTFANGEGDWFPTSYSIRVEFGQNRSYTDGEWLLPNATVYANDSVLGTFLYKPLNDDLSQGWLWHVTSYRGDSLGANDTEIDQLQNMFDWIENGLLYGQQVAPEHDDGNELLRQVNFAFEFIHHTSLLEIHTNQVFLPAVSVNN